MRTCIGFSLASGCSNHFQLLTSDSQSSEKGAKNIDIPGLTLKAPFSKAEMPFVMSHGAMISHADEQQHSQPGVPQNTKHRTSNKALVLKLFSKEAVNRGLSHCFSKVC